MNYTFIHPTKTGGTACEIYFEKYYSDYIKGKGHFTQCTNDNNPIIIIRDVIERFISMYKYWKYGPIDTIFKKNNDELEKNKKYNINDFITMIKNNDTQQLFNKTTWDKHFFQQHYWINNTEYKNIIIIKYDKNLNEKINKLITLIHIPNKNIPLPIINTTKENDENIILTNENFTFIKNYFKDDYDFIEKINNNPELFKLVL